MPDPALNLGAPHHEAEELLAWYATGRLDGDDLAMVERHLSSCAHCRRQLGFERRMIGEFAELAPQADAGWARLRRRIEREREGLWRHLLGQMAETWRSLSRPAIATLALAQLAILVVVTSLFLSLTKPDYRALASADPAPAANVIAMFSPDTTVGQMRDLLKANGASLVEGPTAADAYLLQVPAASRTAAINRLRTDRHVLMAQPIDGSSS